MCFGFFGGILLRNACVYTPGRTALLAATHARSTLCSALCYVPPLPSQFHEFPSAQPAERRAPMARAAPNPPLPPPLPAG